MTLRRIIRSHDHGLFAPVQSLIWTPRNDSYCGKCNAWFDQAAGSPTAGPRCETCDHVVKAEEIVEQGRTSIKILAKCHGAEELHVFDLGSETAWEDASNPGDEYAYVRRVRMADRYFVPSEQGDATVVGSGL